MLPCHNYYSYGIWRSKELGGRGVGAGGGLMSSNGVKLKG